jgi:hypothetical protein
MSHGVPWRSIWIAAADALLADVELVPAVEGPVRWRGELNASSSPMIPAMLATPDAWCGSGGRAPSCRCWVEQDVPRLGQLLKDGGSGPGARAPWSGADGLARYRVETLACPPVASLAPG